MHGSGRRKGHAREACRAMRLACGSVVRCGLRVAPQQCSPDAPRHAIATAEAVTEAEVRSAAQIAVIRDGLRVVRACYRCERVGDVLVNENGGENQPDIAVNEVSVDRRTRPPAPPLTGPRGALAA
jgi:hypothetical protein